MPHSGRPLAAVIALALLFAVSYVLPPPVAAQTDSSSVDTYRAQLQSQLDALNAQIAAQQKILDQAQTQAASLSKEIAVLNAEIKQAQLAIEARNVVIEQLTSGIADKQTTITGLNSQLGSELESLAAIMREKNQLDTTPLVVAALSDESLSDFFSDIDTFDEINAQMQQSFTQISDTKQSTQAAQDALQSQLDEETQLKQVQQLQEQQIQAQQTQENQLLAQTKGQESSYETLIAKNQQSAAQIRTALFQLTGSAAISFGTALDYANEASKATGIRPAFLLGIIREESNLGQNVGTGTWTIDMKAPRDTAPFKSITSSLGLNPDTMPVSKKQSYGYGGAMGPAQFIPSTWVCYAGYINSVTGKCTNSAGTGVWTYTASADRVGKLTGNQPPNPWNPEDAFMAAAVYLTDDGAAKQTASAEFYSAMCYLAGCGNQDNTSLQFYGQNVAMYASQYQCQIDIINGKGTSANCQNL